MYYVYELLMNNTMILMVVKRGTTVTEEISQVLTATYYQL